MKFNLVIQSVRRKVCPVGPAHSAKFVDTHLGETGRVFKRLKNGPEEAIRKGYHPPGAVGEHDVQTPVRQCSNGYDTFHGSTYSKGFT